MLDKCCITRVSSCPDNSFIQTFQNCVIKFAPRSRTFLSLPGQIIRKYLWRIKSSILFKLIMAFSYDATNCRDEWRGTKYEEKWFFVPDLDLSGVRGSPDWFHLKLSILFCGKTGFCTVKVTVRYFVKVVELTGSSFEVMLIIHWHCIPSKFSSVYPCAFLSKSWTWHLFMNIKSLFAFWQFALQNLLSAVSIDL